MISYSDIIYVGSSKPLICRDGNIQYAKSMDLPFYTYDDLVSGSIDPITDRRFVILDISAGWTTSEDMDKIEKYIETARFSSCRRIGEHLAIRLVDQFSHQRNTEIYLRMMKISIDYGITIIRTYDVDYYDLPNQSYSFLPYPYLEEDEITRGESKKVLNRIILSGASVKGIYPMREKLYELKDSISIDTLGHPGYSGKYWSSGKIGNEYIDLLSKYAFMACTTCNEGYELLKYIECAEAGCIPVGEVPNSLKMTEAENYIIKIPESALSSVSEFDKWFINLFTNLDYHRYISSYRRCIKDMRGKNIVKDKLLYIINNEIHKGLK